MARTTAAPRSKPRREDCGALVVLHLYGSYREMGRQHVELLGPIARDVYELQREHWARLIESVGAIGRVADSALPRFWMDFWWRWEGSRNYEEIRGMAEALGVSGPDACRGVLGILGSGTTTLVATGKATADGMAVIAKNSDWTDCDGVRRPLIIHCNPDNGDLPHVIATWPLLGCPIVGLNSAGFAIGVNFFMADQVLGFGPVQWPWRRALQTATSVSEGVHVFRSARNRSISGFFSMADSAGEIALLECAPRRIAVARPKNDWFAQSNHARTSRMTPHDRGGDPDSYKRRDAMEAAVRPLLGKITPQLAADVLRDRANSPHVNESVVANAAVLNSNVVQPASGTLWASAAQQPQAPFGEMLPFKPGDGDSPAASIPADPRLGTPEMAHELDVLKRLREAVRLFREGGVEEAGAVWERLATEGEGLAAPSRLTWARARVRWTLGRMDEAEPLLAALDTDETPFDVRAHALVAHAWLADRAGRRDDAVARYRRALAYLDAHPQYNHEFTIAPARGWAAAGLKAPQTSSGFPETPDLQKVG